MDPDVRVLPRGRGVDAPGRRDRTLTDACQRAGFRPRIDFEAREWTAKEGFVAAGLGLALVPTLSAGTVGTDIVVRPLHPRDAPVRQIFAATRAGTPAPPVAAFLPCLGAAAHDLRAAAPGLTLN